MIAKCSSPGLQYVLIQCLRCEGVQGSVEGVQVVMATSLVIGCAAASSALWYYSRRYVGELSLVHDQHTACFSVLDFWGNREVGMASVFVSFASKGKQSLVCNAESADLCTRLHCEMKHSNLQETFQFVHVYIRLTATTSLLLYVTGIDCLAQSVIGKVYDLSCVAGHLC